MIETNPPSTHDPIARLFLELINYKKYIIIGVFGGLIFSSIETSILEKKVYVFESTLIIPYYGGQQIIDSRKLASELKAPDLLNVIMLSNPKANLNESLGNEITEIYSSNQISKDLSGITLTASGHDPNNTKMRLQLATNLLANYLTKRVELFDHGMKNRQDLIGKKIIQLEKIGAASYLNNSKGAPSDTLVASITALNKLEAELHEVSMAIESTASYSPIVKDPTPTFAYKNRKGLIYWLGSILIGAIIGMTIGLFTKYIRSIQRKC